MKRKPKKKRTDDVIEFLSTWIQERVEYAAKTRGRWFDEISDWAESAMRSRGRRDFHNHYNEPPIPEVLGFVAEAAANHNIGVSQEDFGGYEKIVAEGLMVAVGHGEPQTSLTDPMAPNAPFPRSWTRMPMKKSKGTGRGKKRPVRK